jgi:hypothetical protein
MPKRITIPGEAVTEATEAAEAFETYGGKTPPAGTFRCVVANARFNEANRNGDPYFTVRFRIDHEADEPKSRFNGYSRTGNITMSDAQAKYNKQFCEAVGITAKALHHPLLADDGEAVEKFGGTDVSNLRLRVAFTNGSYQGRRQLNPRSFLVDREDDADVADAPDEDYSYDDADAPSDEYDADADVYTGDDADEEYAEGDEGEEGEEAAEEGDGDEYAEEEPEPVKAAPRKAVKAPPTKVAAKKAPAKAARKPF